MKKLTDYTFYNSWQLKELNIQPNKKYILQTDLGNLQEGEEVVFAGFDDVDNHFGIFVFIKSTGDTVEFSGDFSELTSYKLLELKRAISTN